MTTKQHERAHYVALGQHRKEEQGFCVPQSVLDNKLADLYIGYHDRFATVGSIDNFWRSTKNSDLFEIIANFGQNFDEAKIGDPVTSYRPRFRLF